MNPNILIGIVAVVSLIIGIFVGRQFLKIKSHRDNKKLLENLQEVIEGKRENAIEIEGKKYDASTFILKDENDKIIIMDLKGGVKKQDGKERTTREKEEGNHFKEAPPCPRKDSRSIRKKKRTSRGRHGRRIRRFG